jgi:ATP-binding cassette subfamily E protein 1
MSALAKRKAKDSSAVDRRILILDPEKCKPNSAAYAFLKQYAGKCGKTCIEVQGKLVRISEGLCAACLTRAKHCPGGAVSIVKLPTNLTTNMTHRYGENAFVLHGLPTPRPGQVLGLLGTNGIGKSTAVHVLSGRIKPNLGVIVGAAPSWADIIAYYRGSDLQNYFTALCEDRLRVVVKPQLEPQLARKFVGRTVGDSLRELDERGRCEDIIDALDLRGLLGREVQLLSGGELQRFAIARCLCVDADVYLFDEPSSFLDVKQRVAAAATIRSLVEASSYKTGMGQAGTVEATRKAQSTYAVVVEHDLTVLDHVSDTVCCLYGGPGAYGVVTKRQTAANGINQFLAGYIQAENMRFRAEALSFQVSVQDAQLAANPQGSDDVAALRNSGENLTMESAAHTYPAMTRTLTTDKAERPPFTLHVEAGSFRDGEIIGLMGENGCGKSTFMQALAGTYDDDRKTVMDTPTNHGDHAPASSLKHLGVSYKRQHIGPRFRKFPGTVQDFLEARIQHGLGDRLFRLLVMKPLGLEKIESLPVRSLSGGEIQRLAITICLGTPANIYLVDEPSAGLDVEQRIIAAKVMKRWVVSHLGKTAFIIEHDFVMATALYDRVVVYRGDPGIECTAGAPLSPAKGFNEFLRKLDITFRRDPENYRPRINKCNSVLDREQKKVGDYYNLDEDDNKKK